ncbi:hypothetical protein L7F22_001597 [Adiantum nelumboides]|nr:hypothetical protein [Adiantum nelumboides]
MVHKGRGAGDIDRLSAADPAQYATTGGSPTGGNRASVDAREYMVHGAMAFKWLSLTDIKIDIPRMPKKTQLATAINFANVHEKWPNSSYGRNLNVQKKRASLSDFDRFKVMAARIKRTSIVK